MLFKVRKGIALVRRWFHELRYEKVLGVPVDLLLHFLFGVLVYLLLRRFVRWRHWICLAIVTAGAVFKELFDLYAHFTSGPHTPNMENLTDLLAGMAGGLLAAGGELLVGRLRERRRSVGEKASPTEDTQS